MSATLAAPLGTQELADASLAQECLLALRGHVTVPRNVTVTVSSGRATLEGIVDWDFQKQAAESAITYIRGVREVRNRIVIDIPDLDKQAG